MPTTNYHNKFFIIDVELYSAQFLISINQEIDDLVLSVIENQIVPSLESPYLETYMVPFLDMKMTTLARTVFYENGTVAIKLNNYSKDNIEDLATLVHELSHATMFTFQRIGMPHTSDTDEAYSYLLGFLTKKFFEKLG